MSNAKIVNSANLSYQKLQLALAAFAAFPSAATERKVKACRKAWRRSVRKLI